MCIYWTLVDWPDWMLNRSFAWPCLSIIRSTLMHELEGGAAYLARVILQFLFPETGDSIERGVFLRSPDGHQYMVTAIFAGWLCDLAGHKEVLGWKGWGGNVCCHECRNLDRRHRGPMAADGTIGIDCADESKFNNGVAITNEAIFAVIDDLHVRHSEKRKTEVGFNHVPNGLLSDVSLRRLYMPVQHTIRDWQHTLASDGVGNTLIVEVVRLIGYRGYTADQVREFASLVVLPHKYGVVQTAWLAPARFKPDTLSSFSSIILTLVPVLMLFLNEFCKADHELTSVVRMFYLFHTILGVLSTGPSEAPKHAEKLRRMISEFHMLYAELTWYLKPKVHHFHHIIDGMMWLGKSLSCFVTERKHRIVKDSALHVFRHIEHTVLADVINKQCHQYVQGVDLFKRQFLHQPRSVAGSPDVRRSVGAVCHCGMLHRGDVCWLRDTRVGRVVMFYEIDGSIGVEIDIYQFVNDEPSIVDETRSTRTFVEVSALVDACTWFQSAPGIITISIPSIVVI